MKTDWTGEMLPWGLKSRGQKGLHYIRGNCQSFKLLRHPPQNGTKTMSTKIGTCKITSLLAPSYLYTLLVQPHPSSFQRNFLLQIEKHLLSLTLFAVSDVKKKLQMHFNIFYYLELTKLKKN